MRAFPFDAPWQWLVITAALPLGLMSAGIAPAFAGSVTVTGANGANAASARTAGGAGGAATATTTTSMFPGDASNSATATGGNGGRGSKAFRFCVSPLGGCFVYGAGAGGPGGAATSTATTSISTGSSTATATATSNGGAGGQGGVGLPGYYDGGQDGNGGAATATATGVFLTGNVQANASATGGAGGTSGTASAKSDAKNTSGEVVTTASAAGEGAGTSPSAFTEAAVGSVSLAPAKITPGHAVSNAIRASEGAYLGEGAMSAGPMSAAYGGLGPLQYEATSTFSFKAPASGTLYLNLLADQVSGIGFDSSELVVVEGTTAVIQRSFSSPGSAETFLATDPSLFPIVTGSPVSVEIEFFLDYKSGTSAVTGNGFAFTYDLATTHGALTPAATLLNFAPASSIGNVPEPSTWAMMLIGFAALGVAGFQASYWNKSVVADQSPC